MTIAGEGVRVVILGSGTCVPQWRRSSPSIALFYGEQALLVDCGPGTLRRMSEAGIDYRNLHLLLLTHFHLDHVSDLPAWLFALRNTHDLPTGWTLEIVGPKGTQSLVNRLRAAHDPWLQDLPFGLSVSEVGSESRRLHGWKVTFMPVRHSSLALGLRLQAGPHAVAISGDTDYCPAVVQLCKDADLAILECSLPDDQKVDGHLTPSLAGRIAQEAGCKKLVLVHLYPPCDQVDVVTPCARQFAGPITVAEDLMTIGV
ncbi:MAG: ribonuclease Z [candidate division KSB1 bacterium]|nr:ribonuclease Z [candidate division KSB1 bacterium]